MFWKDWLIDWLIDWLREWLIDWLSDWLIEWLSDRLIDWLIEWVIDWGSEWLIDWLIDFVFIPGSTLLISMAHRKRISSCHGVCAAKVRPFPARARYPTSTTAIWDTAFRVTRILLVAGWPRPAAIMRRPLSISTWTMSAARLTCSAARNTIPIRVCWRGCDGVSGKNGPTKVSFGHDVREALDHASKHGPHVQVWLPFWQNFTL